MKTKLESKFESEFMAWVHKQGGLAIKLPSNMYTGIPDRMVLYEGKVAFIELKREGFKPRPIQQFWLDELKKRRFTSFWLTPSEFNKKYKNNGIETLWVSRDPGAESN